MEFVRGKVLECLFVPVEVSAYGRRLDVHGGICLWQFTKDGFYCSIMIPF